MVNPKTGQILGDYHGWIHTREANANEWRKLIPGCCPQWFPEGKRFCYFLDIGYDGSRCELWYANPDGDGRFRLTRSDYWIQRSPVISEDGKRVAHHYSCCRASGGFEDIVLIDLSKRSPDGEVEETVVLRKPEYAKVEALRWLSATTLQVILQGEEILIDTSRIAETHAPLP